MLESAQLFRPQESPPCVVSENVPGLLTVSEFPVMMIVGDHGFRPASILCHKEVAQ